MKGRRKQELLYEMCTHFYFAATVLLWLATHNDLANYYQQHRKHWKVRPQR